jgi:hypothetical protein
MGKDGSMWGAEPDTFTLEEYRRLRDKTEHKKSDFIEAINDQSKGENTDVWQER